MLQRSRTERQICSCPLDHSRDSVCFLNVVLHIIIIIIIVVIIVVIIILGWGWYATYAHRSSSESSFPLCWPGQMKGLSHFCCDFLEFPQLFMKGGPMKGFSNFFCDFQNSLNIYNFLWKVEEAISKEKRWIHRSTSFICWSWTRPPRLPGCYQV